ncbi:hypothetical protein BJY01DRAFT_262807 [Aspergillus pseudoustus]|uniref:Acetoacetate decarboxylase n=1 Tax=Aspergillus pseudoustus TaxID=1810923 RepID=A0ABR4ICD4_9EURO
MSAETKPAIESSSTWKDARGHIFLCISRPSSARAPAPASYHRNEEKSPFAKQTFAGGLQACVIVRYLQSPIGAYDELLWIPGAFEIPWSGEQTYRATRAYVSTDDSVSIGRRNWNVPKMLANFEFTPSESGHLPYSRVSVSPYDETEPFMQLDLQPMFLGSRPFLPINTKYVPINFLFDFPPLPESGDNSHHALIGTSDWKRVRLEISGMAGVVKITGSMGDGIHFPRLEQRAPWLWLKDARIRIEGVQVQPEESATGL